MASVKETISNLKKITELLAIEKEYSSALVENMRLLIDADEITVIKDLALQAASDISTIECNYNEFGRIGFYSKKFAVREKRAK